MEQDGIYCPRVQFALDLTKRESEWIPDIVLLPLDLHPEKHVYITQKCVAPC